MIIKSNVAKAKEWASKENSTGKLIKPSKRTVARHSSEWIAPVVISKSDKAKLNQVKLERERFLEKYTRKDSSLSLEQETQELTVIESFSKVIKELEKNLKNTVSTFSKAQSNLKELKGAKKGVYISYDSDIKDLLLYTLKSSTETEKYLNLLIELKVHEMDKSLLEKTFTQVKSTEKRKENPVLDYVSSHTPKKVYEVIFEDERHMKHVECKSEKEAEKLEAFLNEHSFKYSSLNG